LLNSQLAIEWHVNFSHSTHTNTSINLCLPFYPHKHFSQLLFAILPTQTLQSTSVCHSTHTNTSINFCLPFLAVTSELKYCYARGPGCYGGGAGAGTGVMGRDACCAHGGASWGLHGSTDCTPCPNLDPDNEYTEDTPSSKWECFLSNWIVVFSCVPRVKQLIFHCSCLTHYFFVVMANKIFLIYKDQS
jgi:hypothetical protein